MRGSWGYTRLGTNASLLLVKISLTRPLRGPPVRSPTTALHTMALQRRSMSQCGSSPDSHTPSHSTVPSANSPGVFRSPAASGPNQPKYGQASQHGPFDAAHEQPAKRSEKISKSNYPLDNVQEHCLLRHFVEVISSWVGSTYLFKPRTIVLMGRKITTLTNETV